MGFFKSKYALLDFNDISRTQFQSRLSDDYNDRVISLVVKTCLGPVPRVPYFLPPHVPYFLPILTYLKKINYNKPVSEIIDWC